MPAKKKMDKSEKMFSKMLKEKKVKDLDKARKKVAKKTGTWPLGNTR